MSERKYMRSPWWGCRVENASAKHAKYATWRAITSPACSAPTTPKGALVLAPPQGAFVLAPPKCAPVLAAPAFSVSALCSCPPMPGVCWRGLGATSVAVPKVLSRARLPLQAVLLLLLPGPEQSRGSSCVRAAVLLVVSAGVGAEAASADQRDSSTAVVSGSSCWGRRS